MLLTAQHLDKPSGLFSDLNLLTTNSCYNSYQTHNAVSTIFTGIGGAVIVVGFTQSTLKSFRT